MSLSETELPFSSKKRNYYDSNCIAVDDMFKRLCLDNQGTSQPNTETRSSTTTTNPKVRRYTLSQPADLSLLVPPRPNRRLFPVTPDRVEDYVSDAGPTAKKRNCYENSSRDTCYKKVRWNELRASSSSFFPCSTYLCAFELTSQKKSGVRVV